MSSFKRGLRNRNPLVLAIAAVLAGAALLGLQSLFTSGVWTMVPLKYWVRYAQDDSTVVSWRTGELKRDPPKQPLLVLVAGSSGREAIWSGASLAAQVKADGGPSIVASNLSSAVQSVGQSLAIVDNLPVAPATTVLVGINMLRLSDPASSSLQQVAGRNLLLKSDTLRRFVVGHSGRDRGPYAILPSLLDYLTGQLEGLWYALPNCFSGGIKLVHYDPHWADRLPKITPQRVRELRRWANGKASRSALKKNLSFTVALLGALIRRGQERGMNIVLVELPHNPGAAGPGLAQAQAYYRAPIHTLATKYGIPYIDFNEQLGLTAQDFYDFSHLCPSGRDVWQAKLSRVIVRLYRKGVIRATKDGPE